MGNRSRKSSRIENGRTPPSDADIRAWCRACGADDQVADLIAANRQSAEMYVQWKRLQRTGLRRLQESGATLYQRTRLFRVYCSDAVPGLLQTPGYATALLSSIAAFRGTPDDVSEAVTVRMKPSEIDLHRKAFAALSALTVYGATARALILSAIQQLDR
jgi:hypothetical protein